MQRFCNQTSEVCEASEVFYHAIGIIDLLHK